MSKNIYSLLGAALLAGAAIQLSAQPPSEPPKVLRIFREDIKEGKNVAHEKTEANFVQALARLKYPNNVLAMTTLTGMNQAWFLEAHDSFESIGKAEAFAEKEAVKVEMEKMDALDSEYRSSSRSWIAVYHPEMSYRAKELVETLPKARYFNVIIMRVRQERDQEFGDLAKMAIAAAERSNNDQPVVTYQIVSGAPNGTYLLLEPTPALKTLDEGPARSRAMFQAMGDSGVKKFTKTAEEAIATEESMLFTIDPKMSMVSKEFAAVDPEFWTPKPAAKPAAKSAQKATAAK